MRGGTAKDITGHRFGMLTAVSFTKRVRSQFWLCKCDCGNVAEFYKCQLLKGATKSCGCARTTTRGVRRDWSGRRFGMLTAIDFRTVDGERVWRCQCDCGRMREVKTGDLTRARKPTRSCGCLGNDGNLRHGLAGTRTYRSWVGMRARCGNPKTPAYKNYGARGITVCERWSKFELFLEDMGICPPGMSIDRIDNNLGYSRGNCHWATPEMQAQNQRRCAVDPGLVRHIRELYRNGATPVEIEREYGVSRGVVLKVATYKSWKNVADLFKRHRRSNHD